MTSRRRSWERVAMKRSAWLSWLKRSAAGLRFLRARSVAESLADESHLLLLTITVLSSRGEVELIRSFPVDGLRLTVAGEPGEVETRAKGPARTAHAILDLGAAMLAAVHAGANGDRIDALAIQMALMGWLFDATFGRLTTEQFLAHDIQFTIFWDGTVRRERLPV